jgi:diguanylate cyclase (GGDEF)-like protein
MKVFQIRKPRPETTRFLAWLVVGVLGLNLLIFAYSALTMVRAWEESEENAAQWTQNLALALEKELTWIMKASDMLLLSVIDEVYRQQAAGIVDAAALNAHIDPLRTRFPYIDGVRLTDASGIVRYGSDITPDKAIDVSDREHFKALLDQHEDTLVISRPQKSRANGKWVIVFARRMNKPDGSFGGMAFVPIPVENLTRTFAEIEIPPGGSITLRAADLAVIARYPPSKKGGDPVGQATVGEGFTRLLASGATHGTFRAVTPLDGVSRLLSFRKVADYPLYLIVGRAEEEFLGEWKRARVQAVVTLTAFILLTLSLSLLVHTYWKKLTHALDAMQRMAHTDFLTGLANRRAFIDAAELELARARRYATPMSLLMVDIDLFKQINDTRGHEAGDEALKGLAACALAELREVDLMGRWGGEEFVVLLPETDAASAAEVAERLRVAVENAALPCGKEPVRVTVSIGYAELAPGDADIDALVRNADDALYRAKNAGRNRICGPETVAG